MNNSQIRIIFLKQQERQLCCLLAWTSVFTLPATWTFYQTCNGSTDLNFEIEREGWRTCLGGQTRHITFWSLLYFFMLNRLGWILRTAFLNWVRNYSQRSRDWDCLDFFNTASRNLVIGQTGLPFRHFYHWGGMGWTTTWKAYLINASGQQAQEGTTVGWDRQNFPFLDLGTTARPRRFDGWNNLTCIQSDIWINKKYSSRPRKSFIYQNTHFIRTGGALLRYEGEVFGIDGPAWLLYLAWGQGMAWTLLNRFLPHPSSTNFTTCTDWRKDQVKPTGRQIVSGTGTVVGTAS